jgi:hypothetical protein
MREFIIFVGFIGKRSNFLAGELAYNRLEVLDLWIEVGDAIEVGGELVEGACD